MTYTIQWASSIVRVKDNGEWQFLVAICIYSLLMLELFSRVLWFKNSQTLPSLGRTPVVQVESSRVEGPDRFG
eukprot:c44732_g1_i1 orf=138-356(+)